MGAIAKQRNRGAAARRMSAANRTLRPRSKVRFAKTIQASAPKIKVKTTETHPLLTCHNTPVLLRRRAARIAESNAQRTKVSDDALADVLKEFQKISF
jgi:hypothetical protein